MTTKQYHAMTKVQEHFRQIRVELLDSFKGDDRTLEEVEEIMWLACKGFKTASELRSKHVSVRQGWQPSRGGTK